MLFQARFWPLIVDGSVTVTFRRWKRRQVVAGHRYRTGHRIVGRQLIEVDAVEIVDPASITDADARRAGFPMRRAWSGSSAATPRSPCTAWSSTGSTSPTRGRCWPPTADLSPADRAEIDRRLDRLDRASTHGPWTRAVLAAIAARPATRAADLAAGFGRETAPFKVDVRKLKNLGLTESLEVGYRLSPAAHAYLDGAG